MTKTTMFNILRGIVIGSGLNSIQKQKLLKFITELEDCEANVDE